MDFLEELPFLWVVAVPTRSLTLGGIHFSGFTFLAFSSMSPDSIPGPRCLKVRGKSWGWDGGGAGGQDSSQSP